MTSEPGEGAVRVRVSGRVQGVGFRYHMVRHAERLGVVGYARNLEDGDVEIWAEGDSEALHRLVQAARVGPPMARVRDVDVEPVSARGSFESFEVRF